MTFTAIGGGGGKGEGRDNQQQWIQPAICWLQIPASPQLSMEPRALAQDRKKTKAREESTENPALAINKRAVPSDPRITFPSSVT